MSIPMEKLKAYKWPKPNFPIGQEVLDRTTPDDPRGIPDDNLVSLIPLVGWIWMLILLCKDSDPGANQYGENPKGM